MSKKLILILALLCTGLTYANDMEEGYAAVKQQYELRDKGASKALQDYLKRYPYTTYADARTDVKIRYFGRASTTSKR